MSVSLAVTNPEAHERLTHQAPLPRVGTFVLFCPRPSEIRAGMPQFPALVMRRDEANQLLDLLVIKGADDFLHLERLARRIENDQGWDYIGSDDRRIADEGPAMARLDAFQAELAAVLFGEGIEKPEIPLLAIIGKQAEIIAGLETRLVAIETYLNQLEGHPTPPKSKKES